MNKPELNSTVTITELCAQRIDRALKPWGRSICDRRTFKVIDLYERDSFRAPDQIGIQIRGNVGFAVSLSEIKEAQRGDL